MSKRYYWLKLKENFFDDPRIKKLRRMEHGADLVLIYMKMLLKGINDNGKIYFESIEDTFPEEIALCIDEDVELVEKAIEYLISKQLVEDMGAEYFLPATVSMVGSETDKAELMRKKREKDKLQNKSNIVT